MNAALSTALYRLVGTVVCAVKHGNVNYFYKGKLTCENAETGSYQIEDETAVNERRYFSFREQDVRYTNGSRIVFYSNAPQFH